MDGAPGRQLPVVSVPSSNPQNMRSSKLIAVLNRTRQKSIEYIRKVGSRTIIESLTPQQALAMVRDRDDFRGIGTGRRLRCILWDPQSKPAVWQACWRNTSAACQAFWPDERSAA